MHMHIHIHIHIHTYVYISIYIYIYRLHAVELGVAIGQAVLDLVGRERDPPVLQRLVDAADRLAAT